MIKPIKDKILVSEVRQKQNVESTIITMSPDSKETVFAKVLNVGPNVEEVKIGDVIIVDWGKTTPVDNMTKGLISEEFVIAVVE